VADEKQPAGAGGTEDPDTRRSSKGEAEEPPVNQEEEVRAQLEEEIRKVRVEDVVLQSVVSILNLSARRIAKDDERDLDQAKVGIDAARALVDLVKEDARPQLRQAISELQLLYAKHAGEDEAGAEGERGAKSAPEQGSSEQRGRGPGLWTPPGS